MHVNDIPKRKPFGNYQVTIDLKSLPKTIDQYQKEDGLELCPDFQRGHVWTKDQQISFVEFLLSGGKTQPILLNQPNWSKGLNGRFVCVDGLQRLTAILKFLNNDLPVFGHLRSEIEGIDRLLRRTTLQVYINDLKTDREVLEWYLELNAGGTPHTQEEIDRVKAMLEVVSV